MKRLLHRTQIGLHLPLLLVAFLFLAPILWMLATAFKSPDDIIVGLGALRWLPRPFTFENFRTVLAKTEEFPIWRWTGNSVFISLAVTALVLTVDSLAAFAYARLRWRGRDRLFAILVATMLVPGQALILLNDPTRGIDVGTKQEIYTLLRQLTDSAKGILFYSTDYAELIGCCDRVVILYEGRIVRELTGDELTERNIVTAALNLPKKEVTLGEATC